jgi:hypothetical protein
MDSGIDRIAGGLGRQISRRKVGGGAEILGSGVFPIMID